jgi:hypothetical protein
MTAPEVFERIAAAAPDDDALDEDFIRGLAGRVLNLEAATPADEFEPWWRPANDEQIVEWWTFARGQYTDVHPEVPAPTDAQVIGGQLFADRMGGD